MRKMAAAAIRAMRATPPMTPPAMAPAWEADEDFDGVEEGVVVVFVEPVWGLVMAT